MSLRRLVYISSRHFAKPNLKKQSNTAAVKTRGTLTMNPETRRTIRGLCEYIIENQNPGPGPEVDLAERRAFLKRINVILQKEKQIETKAIDAKIRVKLAAIEALPAELKAEAMKEDPYPWPLEAPWPFNKPPTKRALYEYYNVPL